MILTRPLVFFDLETTGPNPVLDRIVQIACVKVKPDGTRTEWQSLVNPKMPIPPRATEVHGITDEAVKTAPTFYEIARRVENGIRGCDLAGYNIKRFDWPLLRAEFARVKVKPEGEYLLVDALKIFHHFAPRTLEVAVETYCGRRHEGAHDALADARATVDVLEAQLRKHSGQMPETPAEIAAWLTPPRDPDDIDAEGKFRWMGDAVVVTFGRHAGQPLQKVGPKFLKWMLGADFNDDAKAIAKEALAGRFPTRKEAA